MTDEPLPIGHAASVKAAASQRDRTAFAEKFAYFGPQIKSRMLRAGRDATIAEELAQKATLAVWQEARVFDPGKAGASTRIFVIARPLGIDALRHERHPSTLMSDLSEEPADSIRSDRALALLQHEVRIRPARHLLPREQAEVIRKAFFEDKPHAKIEQELGIPLGSVKSRLGLIMAHRRAALEDLA